MFETTIQFKPREQWRVGMTPDKLVEELDRTVKVPGLSNIWVPPIRNRIDMLATGIKSPVGVKVAGTDLAEVRDRLRPVGIVQAEDRRLGEDVSGAEARRMIGISFNLCGPPFMALHQQTNGVRSKGHHRGVKLRLT